MKFGIFFELSVPPPFVARRRAAGVRRTRSSRRCSPTSSASTRSWAVEHHFLEGYSHCSAPEVFLTAVAARTAAHPRRPRRRRVRARDEPPGARRRAGRRPRHHLRRPARARHRPVVDVDRARRLRRRPRPHQEDVGRVRARLPKMWTQDRFAYDGLGVSHARAQRAAQAGAGAAPAAVGHGHHARAPSSTPPTAASAASASPP